VGQQALYWWQDDGWQRGNVARLCLHGAFLHVIAYTRLTVAADVGAARHGGLAASRLNSR
jgi:hypothetical protein